MKVLDLFSGVGGFSTGFEMSGFKIFAANEIDADIAYSYQYNHPKTKMYNMPIQEFKYHVHDLINEIDIILGGPPCQGFSMAGKRNRKKNRDEVDPRNMLFSDYVEVVNLIKPKYFIMENVKGMMSLDNGKYFEMVNDKLTKLRTKEGSPYHITTKILRASDFGVPQERERIIIIGSHKKFKSCLLDSPEESLIAKYGISLKNNIKDAIYDLNYLSSGEGTLVSEYKSPPKSNYQSFMRRESIELHNHIATKHNEIAIDRIKRLKQGESRLNLAESNNIKSVHSGAYGRMSWDKTAKTIITRFDTPSSGEYIHPEQDRTITAREAARLQSIPDRIVFKKSKSSVLKQIGNAVPPLLALYIAETIRITEGE